MKAWVFGGNLAVLINGWTSHEITIQRGFNQGDHIDPFLLLLVIKGLKSLVAKVEDICLYSGFRVGTFRFIVSYLLYVDYTLLMDKITLI